MTKESHIDPSRENFDAFKALDREQPIQMLNLVKFKEQATYPDSHEFAGAGLSGAEAYAKYGEDSGPVFEKVGGIVIWSGEPQSMVIGPESEQWHTAFVAHYPTAHAFLAMVADPVYQKAVIHRQAAVATSRLIRHKPREAGAGFS